MENVSIDGMGKQKREEETKVGIVLRIRKTSQRNLTCGKKKRKSYWTVYLISNFSAQHIQKAANRDGGEVGERLMHKFSENFCTHDAKEGR